MLDEILSNLIITKMYSASTMYTRQNAKLTRKNRAHWALVIKYEGETIYTSNGKRFLSDLHHIIILPKGCSYDWHCTQSGYFSIIEFESELTFSEPLAFHIKNSEKILKKFKDMEYRQHLKTPLIEIENIKDIYSLILTLSQSNSEKYIPDNKRQKILPAIEYISTNYNQKITNDTLAALTGVSTVYFRKLFVSVMGESPISYTRRLRIEKAKEMLSSDYGTLSDIAYSLGYSNLYDFSREFKKHTGIAPSKY